MFTTELNACCIATVGKSRLQSITWKYMAPSLRLPRTPGLQYHYVLGSLYHYVLGPQYHYVLGPQYHFVLGPLYRYVLGQNKCSHFAALMTQYKNGVIFFTKFQ